MSIVRVGLSETKDFAEGYEAIFGKKEPPVEPATPEPAEADAAKTPKSEPKTDPR